MAIGVINLSDAGKIKNIDLLLAKLKKYFSDDCILCRESLTEKSAQKKALYLTKLMNNPNIDWILTTNGGKTSIDIIDFLEKVPLKPIVGYSDIDHISIFLNQKYNTPTIFGPVLKSFTKKINIESLKSAINSEITKISIQGPNELIIGKVFASNVHVLLRMLNKVDLEDIEILLLESHAEKTDISEDIINVAQNIKSLKCIVIGYLREGIIMNRKNIVQKTKLPIFQTNTFGDKSNTISIRNGSIGKINNGYLELMP